MGRRFLAVLVLLVCAPFTASGEDKCVRLKALSNLGIPVHAEPGDRSISHRLPTGTVVTRVGTDDASRWVHIRSETVDGWIIPRYVDGEVPCGGALPSDGASVRDASKAYVIGSWNLEHFKEGKTRGFPENTKGGPSYPSRTQSDYEAIATIIEELDVKILALQEVNGQEVKVSDGDDEDATDVRSPELEKVIGILGSSNYDYVIGSSGHEQHVAILYDKRCVSLEASWEMDIPNVKVQKKGIADRQPLVAHLALLQDGRRMNDLAVVAVHLASGQQNNKNHDRAMRTLVSNLKAAQKENWCIPANENDIVIMGDFNASRFDEHEEQFWDELEANGWDVLANDKNYGPTRLSGVPLGLKSSRIDYVVCTKGNRGLQNEEVSQETAKVHKELLGAGAADRFRNKASDHLPVTISVRVMNDTDDRAMTGDPDNFRKYYAATND